MAEYEAPKKIYYAPYGDMRVNDPITENDIEYTRTDAFIEKACEWLSINMKVLMNVFDVEYDTHDTDIKDFIEDFKNYLKGE